MTFQYNSSFINSKPIKALSSIMEEGKESRGGTELRGDGLNGF
jgi:hypothetical protein